MSSLLLHRQASTRRLALVAVVAATLQIGACSNAVRWEQPVTTSVNGPITPERERIVQVAKSMLGVPYRWGGAQPSGFDCSGLVQYSYNKAGRKVPRTSAAQYRASHQLNLAQARPGDLVFFNFDKRVSHVGIYLGDGRFVHAPSSGKRVEVASLTQPPYRNHFVSAGRILR